MLPKHRLKATDREHYRKDISALKTAFDLVTDHVVVTDADAHILYANKAAEKTTGFTLEEMLGKNPGTLWGGHMPKVTWKKAWHMLKVKKLPVVLDMQNTRKDGTVIWQSLHISPVLDDHKDVRLFIGIEPDITEAKQKEEFREHFFSILGHKTLGPIAGIHWIIELLSERGNLSKKHRSELKELYGESKQLTTLINDLISLSRMGKGHPAYEDVDLIHLLMEVSKKPAGRFSCTKPPWPVVVHTDSSIARAFFQNVCEHLSALAPPNEMIAIAIEQHQKSYVISFAGKMNGTATANDSSLIEIIARQLEWTVHVSKTGSLTIAIPRRT
jgi:PAS domain S-box-containing protein